MKFSKKQGLCSGTMSDGADGSILQQMPLFDMQSADEWTASAIAKLNEQERELKLRYDAILDELRHWIQSGLTSETFRAQCM